MNDICNPKAEELYRIGVEGFCREIQSHIFRSYDQLEDVDCTAAAGLERRLTSLINNGWECDGITVDLGSPLQWGRGSRTHQFHMHAWGPLEILLPGYSLLNNTKALGISIDIASDWVKKFQQKYLLQHLQEGLQLALSEDTTMAWYDMSVGQRVPRLSYLLDVLVRQEASRELIDPLFRSLIFQLEMLSIDSFWISHNNQGLYQALGQLVASRRFCYLPGFECYNKLAQQRIRVILQRQFFDSGIHAEHSPAYHCMVVRSVLGAFRCGLIEDQDLVAMLQRSEEALRWMTAPDNSLVTFGDTDYQPSTISSEDAPTGLVSYSDAGYVFARHASSLDASDDSYFAQMAAFHSRTHKHADHLTCVWHDAGKRILVDPGRYGYGPKTVLGDELSAEGFYYSDPNRRYVESTRAHNCVEIDGKSHKRKGAKPFGSALLFATESNDLWLTLCEVRYQHVRHFRSVIVAPGTFLLVMDWLKDGREEKHDYRQWFQLAPEWVTEKNGNVLLAEHGTCQLSVSSLIDTAALSPIYIGQKDPMQGWISPQAERLMPSPSFNFHQQGIEARFASLFCLAADVKIEQASFNGILTKGKVCWSTEKGLYNLQFIRDGNAISTELKTAM